MQGARVRSLVRQLRFPHASRHSQKIFKKSEWREPGERMVPKRAAESPVRYRDTFHS